MNEPRRACADGILERLKQLAPEDRAAYIDQHCSTAAIRAEVLDKLSDLDADFGGFLAGPAVEGKAGGGSRERRSIGPYRLLEKIGEGGFGVVYLAEQEEPVRRRVALKVLKPGMDSPEIVARFEAERQALALMHHPNIATVFEAGTTGAGHSYFVMELVKGESIVEYCDRNKLSIEERLRLFIQVCRAVQHAHQKGIIHRDLKPSNVLVTVDAELPVSKVIDFGVAKAINQPLTTKTLHTRIGQMIGTPAYMSPEQVERSGLDVDTRSDVYSLGVILYELLTGTTPLDARELPSVSPADLERIICEEEPPTPSTHLESLGDALDTLAHRRKTQPSNLRKELRGDLDWIVMRALEKDRVRRYESASAFASDVESYLRNDPVQACPPSARYKLAKFARKHRSTLIALFLVLLTLTSATVVSIGFAITASREKNRALELTKDLNAALGGLEAEKAHANSQAEKWRREFYGSGLVEAKHFLSLGNGGRAMDVLEESPESLRDWEWHHLRYLADHSLETLASGLDQLFVAVPSPNGRRVLSARRDGTFQLWDVASGEAQWSVNQGEMQGLCDQVPAFSADETRVVTASTELIVLREASSGRPIRKIEGVSAFAVHSTDERILAFANKWNDRPRVVDVTTAAITVLEGSQIRSRHSGFVSAAAFSPDGTRLAIGRDNSQIHIWDSASGARLTTHHNGSYVSALAWTPNSEHLISAGADRMLKRWELESGESIDLGKASTSIRGLCVSPDGRFVLSGGSDSGITVRGAEDGAVLTILRGHASTVTSLFASRRGQEILSTSDDGTIRLWEPVKRPEFVELHEGAVTCVAFGPGGERLASSGADKTVRIWDILTGRQLLKIPLPVSDRNRPSAVAYHPDGTQIASAPGGWEADGRLFVWNAESGELLRELRGYERGFWCIEYSPDGTLLAASGESSGDRRENDKSSLYIWDAASGEERARLSIPDPRNGVEDIAFSADSKKIATAANAVLLWSVDTGEVHRAFDGPYSRYNTVSLSPDGSRVAAACEAVNSLLVWDVESGELIQSLGGHQQNITDALHSPNGRRLFTVSRDGTLRVWNTENGDELLIVELGQSPKCVALSQDGRTVVTAGWHGIRIWQPRGASVDPRL